MKTRMFLHTLVLLNCVVMLLIGGCGDSEEEEEDGDAASQMNPANQQTETAEPSLKTPPDDQIFFSDDFEDGDVADWIGGYYSGTIDLNGGRAGAPLIETNADAAASGNFGLRFTKNQQVGNSAIASSPAFGPLNSPFQVDFDISPGNTNHIIWFGESAPHETYSEQEIGRFGIHFETTPDLQNSTILARAPRTPVLGQYNPDAIYHVTLNVDPATNRFSVTVTGALRDLEGNAVASRWLKNLAFESVASKGIQHINLMQARPFPPISTIGLDNVVVKEAQADAVASSPAPLPQE